MATTRKTKGIGDPSDADAPNARLRAANQGASTQSYSLREPPVKDKTIPSLELLCCRVFADKLPSSFGSTEIVGGVAQHTSAVSRGRTRRTRRQLLQLPDHLVPRLLQQLRAKYPSKLTNAFLVEYFLRGNSITFTSAMTGVSKLTLVAVGEMGAELTKLELNEIDWIMDIDFAVLIRRCTNLVSLNMRSV